MCVGFCVELFKTGWHENVRDLSTRSAKRCLVEMTKVSLSAVMDNSVVVYFFESFLGWVRVSVFGSLNVGTLSATLGPPSTYAMA